MNHDPAPREKQQQPTDLTKEKKLYRKPAFRYERVFETLALSCGKIAGSGFPNCQSSRKSS